MGRRQDTYSSTHTTHTASTQESRRSADSYDSRSTAPTSLYDSPSCSLKGSASSAPRRQSSCQQEDLSPSTSLYPRSSVDTYSSEVSSTALEDVVMDDCWDNADIPPLPYYNPEFDDVKVRPSTPENFAALFPSMNRLSIRHDEFTLDGNMNLRVDTVDSGRDRRRKTVQLFHLRMYDLNKRDFSLRRYCRDSGREVCNSKRKYIEPSSQGRPTLQRTVSNAVKGLGRPPLVRTGTAGSMFSTKSRPGTSYSNADADDEFNEAFNSLSFDKKIKTGRIPTNEIKLEFSNYARVDIQRRGNRNSKRYEFGWWGHKYSWKRVTDKLTGVVSFHLLRDGHGATPVAHIVPETRSPTQVEADENAGGWVPPCHMWISDKQLIDATTDVADVVVATGLMSLVDDCIKERWGTKKVHRIGLPLTNKTVDVEGPKAFVHNLFSRRNSDHSRPTRHPKQVVAY